MFERSKWHQELTESFWKARLKNKLNRSLIELWVVSIVSIVYEKNHPFMKIHSISPFECTLLWMSASANRKIPIKPIWFWDTSKWFSSLNGWGSWKMFFMIGKKTHLILSQHHGQVLSTDVIDRVLSKIDWLQFLDNFISCSSYWSYKTYQRRWYYFRDHTGPHITDLVVL